MMNDPFGSMSGFLAQFQNFMRNPAQFMINSRLPQGALQNPAQAVQQLLNSGAMSQSQLNQLQRVAQQIQSNPMFMKMFS